MPGGVGAASAEGSYTITDPKHRHDYNRIGKIKESASQPRSIAPASGPMLAI